MRRIAGQDSLEELAPCHEGQVSEALSGAGGADTTVSTQYMIYKLQFSNMYIIYIYIYLFVYL